MNSMDIAIAATGLSLILIFLWMSSLSMRKQRLEAEKKAQDAAYRAAIEKAREQEKQERQFKAETGHVPTILSLARESEREKNFQQALYWFHSAAMHGNVTGMYGVVRISEMRGDDIIYKEQANFWRTAIAGEEGNLDAKFATGQAFLFGRGVEKNATKGHELIEEAANEGCIAAMLHMGEWLLSPENVGRGREGLDWYMRAAERDSPEGKLQVGLCHLKGIGTAENRLKGRYWLELAAESGYPEAMYYAGEAWKDTSKTGNAIAYIWLFLADTAGHQPARVLRDEVAGSIGVDVVVGLQSIAKPLQRKLASGLVKKHSIIRALNKVYKREAYFPDEDEFVEGAVKHHDQANLPSDDVDLSPESDVGAQQEASGKALDFTQDLLPAQSFNKPHS